MKTHVIKAIIVDDEKPSRDVLMNFIRENCPQIDVVSECNSIKSAYKSITELQPDLVFLDVEMPKGNGFDLLKMFKTIDFKIIFITAFSEYAVRAFRFSAIDYLLKPIKVSELIDAVNKVIQELSLYNSIENIQALLENVYSPFSENRSLVIPNSKGCTVIRTNDIIMCVADGYCTHFQLVGKTKISSSRNLKYYENLLSDNQFLRVHRSYIINLHHVRSFNFLGQVFLTDDNTCTLGEGFKQSFHRNFKAKI